MTATSASTLFPKITQHVSEIVKVLRELEYSPNELDKEITLEPLSLVGSVKLHGTHADILVYNDSKIVLQTKNVPNITVSNDNLGFAAAMSFNSNEPLDPTYPVLIAGEWVGTGIQKDIAISQLSRRFIIISVRINDVWVLDSQYADIEDPEAGIYNISRGGRFTAMLHPTDIPLTLSTLSPLTESVAQLCPFASSFGVTGEGEGIVWKPTAPHLNSNSALWFKTKGGRFAPSFAPAPKSLPQDVQEKRELADRVAAVWCSEERLAQGWEGLTEMGIRRDMRGLGRFLRWVQTDIVTEEKGFINDNEVDEGILRVSIAKVARLWYIQRVGSGED